MPRGTQVARFYALIMDLARTKHGVPAATLARRHGLSLRTVYRDLHGLESAGFPITSGSGARWKLVDGWDARIPFPLPLGQLLAMHTARELMRPLRGTPAAREFDELYARFIGESRDHGNAQGELFPRLRTVLTTRSSCAIDYSRHEALIETLCRACEQHMTVRAVYFSETRRKTTRRRIDPYAIYYDPRLEALYLFGWCHVRRSIRTFAAHRFRQAQITEQTFRPPEGFTVESYLRGAFRIWRGENSATIRILVDPEIAGWVSERRWHASQKVTRRAGGACELTFEVDGVHELRRFVLQLGAGAEVIEPEWFRLEIGEEQARAASRNRRPARRRVTLDDSGVWDVGSRS